MNYYSIEFFKYHLSLLDKCKNNKLKTIQIINKMKEHLKDRELNNKSAYSKKWMKKPVFEKI